MKKIIIFGLVFLLLSSFVFAAGKPTTTSSTSTTTSSTTTSSTTTTTLSPINPELRYLEDYPILRQIIKNKIIAYINTKFNVCISDINLNPDYLPFRFRDANTFYVVELTMCSGETIRMIKQRQTFRERFLT